MDDALFAAQAENIKRDLQGFADPRTTPSIVLDGRLFEVTWVVRGKERTALFRLDDDGRVSSEETENLYFADFLTSAEVADFSQLAAAERKRFVTTPHFVASDARFEGPGFGQRQDLCASPDNVLSFLESQKSAPEGRTELYFLKGFPGAGKTTLLNELAARQAELFLAGESDFLFLYVTAQGRELSNLQDAFAGELSDLRAQFTRDAIPALTRRGRLIPIIDGFDELLGTAGYGGAFNSLQLLLSELNGFGSVVVAARSSFFDHEFVTHTEEAEDSSNLRLTTIDLEPWTDQQLQEYLSRSSPEDLSGHLSRLTDSDRDLIRRPFFANEFSSFIANSDADAGGVRFYEFLMEAYIARESRKVVDSNGDPLLSPPAIDALFALIAGEMWEQDSRSLSLEVLRGWAEIVAEDFGVGTDAIQQLEAKMSSYAGFESRRPNEFGFEHEVYFDHFLSRALVALLDGGNAPNQALDDLFDMLNRGVIPSSVVLAAGESVSWNDALLERLSSCPAAQRFENRRINQGALLGVALKEEGSLHGLAIDGVSFSHCTFGPGEVRDCSFVNTDFYYADLCGTRFMDCSFAEGGFISISVDRDTHFGITGLIPGKNVVSILLVDSKTEGEEFVPLRIREILEARGYSDPEKEESVSYSKHAQELILMLNFAKRAFDRQTRLYESDESLGRLFQQRKWPELRRLLLDTGVVAEEFPQASGRQVKAYRLRISSDDLLGGQARPGEVVGPARDLWMKLAEME